MKTMLARVTRVVTLALSAGLLVPSLVSFSLLHAAPLRILHTNDLHSHLEHSHDPARGGYAAIKSLMDRLKAQSRAEGIDTLVLDAGDFLEGSPFYMANQGRESWKVMNAMGYDAVAIGNHDWMMGPEELNRIVMERPPSFSFLGANFQVHSSRRALKEHLRPYDIFERAGLKVGVLGLTTSNLVFRWPADRLRPAILTAKKFLPELDEKTDFIIALTHIGLNRDEALARRTRAVDLIVGGHTHTKLEEPVYVRNRRKRDVPIVQTGHNGRFVGELVVDLVKGQEPRVLHYELHPVYPDVEPDTSLQAEIQQARQALYAEYGEAWMNEVIGISEVNTSHSVSRADPWNQVLGAAFVNATGAEVALHVPAFTYPDTRMVGPITREHIMRYYARAYDLRQRLGWNIWKGWLPGWKLLLMQKLGKATGGFLLYAPFVRRINPLRYYQVAFPEGLALGAPEANFIKNLLIVEREDSGVPIWTALEAEIRRVGVIRNPDPLGFAPQLLSSREAETADLLY